MKGRRFRRQDIARGFVARAGALLIAVILLAALLGGGRKYFFCPVMQVVMATSCCPNSAEARERAHDGDTTETLTQPDCCVARRTATLPATPLPAPHPDMLASPVLAVIPAVASTSMSIKARTPARFARHVRAGPKPPSERRADLMIWIC